MSHRYSNCTALLARELGARRHRRRGAVRALVIALVARGHVLVQGVPGLGKTLLAKTLARTLGGDFKRIQGTADLMPSDIIGVHVFDEAARSFVFRPGPLFADVVLVDEINRAGPKTQSALLEAMEERQVSLERERSAAAARTSWCWRRRTRASSRAPIRCPSRSSIASCCASTWTTRARAAESRGAGPLRRRGERGAADARSA